MERQESSIGANTDTENIIAENAGFGMYVYIFISHFKNISTFSHETDHFLAIIYNHLCNIQSMYSNLRCAV